MCSRSGHGCRPAGWPPGPEETITTIPDLVLWDDAIAQLPVEERTAMAREAERAALDYDSRITIRKVESTAARSHTSSTLVAMVLSGTIRLVR